MEKINVEEIKADYSEIDYNSVNKDHGLGTVSYNIGLSANSLKILANKINEIIDVLNEKEEWKNSNYYSMMVNKAKNLKEEYFLETQKKIKADLSKDWEKEFDKEFGETVYDGGFGISELKQVKQFIHNLLK
jgi:hypothetical protein